MNRETQDVVYRETAFEVVGRSKNEVASIELTLLSRTEDPVLSSLIKEDMNLLRMMTDDENDARCAIGKARIDDGDLLGEEVGWERGDGNPHGLSPIAT